MSARAEILSRIRARLGFSEDGAEARREAARRTIAEKTYGPRPALGDDLLGRFCDKSRSMSSTLDRVGSLAEVPAAVRRYLDESALPRQAVAWPMFAGLDWHGEGIDVAIRAPRDADPVGLTGCFCALAETGTLMLLSGPQSPATTSLLPETHIAIVPVARIVRGMEEGFALMRAECAQAPRAINFVSGPSRTGDIEQTIVLGAHGPYRVHLILVG
jgi:L-lactate dehydrogenase complex protein LldG